MLLTGYTVWCERLRGLLYARGRFLLQPRIRFLLLYQEEGGV